jgi:hypothetical protein
MLEIRIADDLGEYYTKILVADITGDRYTVFNLYTGQSSIIQYGEVINPEFIMKVPRILIRQGLFQKLITALNEYGVKPQEQSNVEGKHEAQSKHLEDLQKILVKQGIM